MFNRRKAEAEARAEFEKNYYETNAKFRGMADEWAGMAPNCFPDGTPYPARELLYGLADSATTLAYMGYPDRVWQGVTVLMATVRDVGKEEVNLEILEMLWSLRLELERAGRDTEAAAMAAAGTAVNTFREQSGVNDDFINRFNAEREAEQGE